MKFFIGDIVTSKLTAENYIVINIKEDMHGGSSTYSYVGRYQMQPQIQLEAKRPALLLYSIDSEACSWFDSANVISWCTNDE